MKIINRNQRRGNKLAQTAESINFEARCPSGHLITGQRQEKFQAIRCPECSEGIFVLPTSWLPVPPSSSPGKVVKLSQFGKAELLPSKVGDYDGDDGDEELVEMDNQHGSDRGSGLQLSEYETQAEADESDLSEDPAASYPVEPGREVNADELARIAREDLRKNKAQPKQDRRARRDQSAKSAVKKTQADDNSDDQVDQMEEDFSPDEQRLPLFKRVGTKTWIMLGVTVVISLTIYFQIRQRHREKLPQLAQLGRTQGMELLKSGKFDEAKKILADAASAYAEMNDRTEVAREIQQASREAAILADLVGRPLEEILDRYAAGGEGKAEFESLEKDRSIIIESRITSTPDNGGVYDIDYRIAVGPGPDSARPLGRLDLSSLILLKNLKPELGDQLLIGLRIQGFELTDSQWLVKVDPQSGVLMTNWDALATIGWPVSDRPGSDAPNQMPESP